MLKNQKSKKIEDEIVDRWHKDDSEILCPAGKNIFGQPTQPTTTDQPKIPKPPTKKGPALELKKYF